MIDWNKLRWDSYKENPIKRFKKSGKPVTGQVKKKGLFHVEDILTITYQNGKEHGPFHIKHGGETEYQVTKGSFIKGEIDGLVRRYYDNGDTLYSKGKAEIFRFAFANDKGEMEDRIELHFVGKIKHYTKDGSLSLTVDKKEKNGKKIETYESYYSNGKKETIFTLVDRSLEGKREEYFKDGTLRKECEYYDGEPNGLFREYYPDNTLKSEGIYKNRSKDGKWNYYYENSSKKREESYDTPDNYIKQSLAGPVIGDEIFKKNNEGRAHGKWRYYDRSGNCTKVENYEKGYQHGITIKYDRNGNPIRHKYSKGRYRGKESKVVSFFKGLKNY